MTIDRDDIEQAVEIALGERLSNETSKSRSITQAVVERETKLFRRILRELPGHIDVQDMLDALEE